jgi:hypothetical protein
MALSVGFRITVSLLILLPKLRGSDSYPGGTDSHRTRQPSLDAQRLLLGTPRCRLTANSTHSPYRRSRQGRSMRVAQLFQQYVPARQFAAERICWYALVEAVRVVLAQLHEDALNPIRGYAARPSPRPSVYERSRLIPCLAGTSRSPFSNQNDQHAVHASVLAHMVNPMRRALLTSAAQSVQVSL